MSFKIFGTLHFLSSIELRQQQQPEVGKEMGKMKDLWGAEGGVKAVNRPQPVRTSATWTLPPEAVPIDPAAPRRRKYEHVLPNKRAAVALPSDGQSYNPEYQAHQEILAETVKRLQKRQKKHAKLEALLSLGKNDGIKGNFEADKTWDEEVQEQKPPKPAKKGPATQEKKKKKKKQGKKAAADAAKKALPHRRHPDRDKVIDQVAKIDKIAKEVEKKVKKTEKRAVQKIITRQEGQEIKNFGRYHHTPLLPDVVPTDKLVGSLRHVSGSYIHPALDRIKSLEERNIIPARMRHTFNKRKLLKPKGDVRLKTETFGVMPETSH